VVASLALNYFLGRATPVENHIAPLSKGSGHGPASPNPGGGGGGAGHKGGVHVHVEPPSTDTLANTGVGGTASIRLILPTATTNGNKGGKSPSHSPSPRVVTHNFRGANGNTANGLTSPTVVGAKQATKNTSTDGALAIPIPSSSSSSSIPTPGFRTTTEAAATMVTNSDSNPVSIRGNATNNNTINTVDDDDANNGMIGDGSLSLKTLHRIGSGTGAAVAPVVA
jgi:hypothetical protein